MLRAFVEVEQIDGLNCSSCTAIAVRSKEVSEKAVNHEMSTEEEAVQRMIRISFAKGKNDSFSCMLDIAEEIKHLQRDHYVDPTFLKSLPAPSQPLATSPSSDNDDSDKVMAASGIMTEEDKLAPTLTIQSLYTQNSRAVIKQTVGDNQRYDDGESTSSVNWTNSNANYDSTSIDAHWPLLRSIISGSSSSSCGTVYEYVLKHRQQATVAKRTFFARLPSILCLHIIRRVPDMFTGKMKKLSQRIQFPLVLDMAPFCGSSGYKNASSGSQNHQSVRSSTYDLCSVVQHLGGEGSGTYILIFACCTA